MYKKIDPTPESSFGETCTFKHAPLCNTQYCKTSSQKFGEYQHLQATGDWRRMATCREVICQNKVSSAVMIKEGRCSFVLMCEKSSSSRIAGSCQLSPVIHQSTSSSFLITFQKALSSHPAGIHSRPVLKLNCP